MNVFNRVPVRVELRPELYGVPFSKGYSGQDATAFFDTTGDRFSLVRVQEGTGPLTAVTQQQYDAWSKNRWLVAIPLFRK